MTCEPPDRFVGVVGAPRSGTTSLFGYLKARPEVAHSVVKEPHYFSQFDLTGLSIGQLRETITTEYLGRFFPDIQSRHSILAEGSVTYLYRPKQMLPILEVWPDAKFIIAVRDPMELLPSLHQRLLYIGDEVVTDFAKAWRLAEDRRNGRKVPRSCVDPRWLLYDEVACLGKYVEQFIATVGRERCFIAVFDDLVKDPASVYQAMIDFVGLPPDARADFVPRRASRGFKFGSLQRLLKRPPKALRGIAAGEHYRHRVRKLDQPADPPLLAATILAARKRLLNWNAATPPTARLDSGLRQSIRAALEEDVERLSSIINRDLSHWLDRPWPNSEFWPEQDVMDRANGRLRLAS